MKNYNFNRIERRGRHEYLKEFQDRRGSGSFENVGYIKCKLVHNKFYSIVIPDQVYLDSGGKLYWIQPLYFSPSSIAAFDEYRICTLSIDISHGEKLTIEFKNDGLVSKLDDGSMLYSCTIKGPRYLHRYVTGSAKITNGNPYIKLHHHTTQEAKKNIQGSNEYWSSNWNIQGTKETSNISYLYLTALPSIQCNDDLREIAMSSEGELAFRVDQNFTNKPDLVLDVYRESTINRTATLSHWVESSLLATQPCFRHTPPVGAVYHQVVCPFVHRLGVESGATIKIDGGVLLPNSSKILDYAVVGDARTISGLAAPYDEEETEEILKVEIINGAQDITGFWMKNPNTNQFDNKDIEEAQFE